MKVIFVKNWVEKWILSKSVASEIFSEKLQDAWKAVSRQLGRSDQVKFGLTHLSNWKEKYNFLEISLVQI